MNGIRKGQGKIRKKETKKKYQISRHASTLSCEKRCKNAKKEQDLTKKR